MHLDKLISQTPKRTNTTRKTVTLRQSSGRGFVDTIADADFESTSSAFSFSAASTSTAGFAASTGSDPSPDSEQKKTLLQKLEFLPFEDLRDPKIRKIGAFRSPPLPKNPAGILCNRPCKTEEENAFNIVWRWQTKPRGKVWIFPLKFRNSLPVVSQETGSRTEKGGVLKELSGKPLQNPRHIRVGSNYR